MLLDVHVKPKMHKVGLGYAHSRVAHGKGEYVSGSVHVNGMEGFWGLSNTNINTYTQSDDACGVTDQKAELGVLLEGDGVQIQPQRVDFC